MNNWKFASAILFGCLPLTLSAAPAPIDIWVDGAVAKPAQWSAKTFRSQFTGCIQSVAYTRKDVKHTAHAVPLWTVLTAAQPKLNPQIKNHLLQFVVLVRGRDGYTAAFSLPELSPNFGDRPAWLALDEDGKPLEDNGPVELVVPEDKKAGRWVHAVAQITVVDEAQAAASGGT